MLTNARRPTRGWGLLELLCVLAAVAVLAALAYPTYLDQLRAARRADGKAAVARLMQAQERWRATRPRYAADLSVATGLGLSTQAATWTSPEGQYSVHVSDARPDGYTVHLQALGAQARDRDCRHLRLQVGRDHPHRHASGPDARVANPASLNRRCWGLG